MTLNETLPHKPWMPYALYGCICVAYALLVIPTWGYTYWDFGDGNYLYIARRVREGLVLYRDILAPQPPLHTFAGVVAQSVGQGVFGSDLIGARAYSLITRLLAGLALLMLGLLFFGCPFRALAGAATYLALPIGFWWSLGYQSENLEIIFLVYAMYFLLPWQRNGALLAGVCSGLACQCNMTGVPFLMANALFLAFRYPRLLPWYLGSSLFVFGAIGIAANIATEGYYLTNVILNQVGTFPRTDILSAMSPTGSDSFPQYAMRKITDEGFKVIGLEGGLIALAIVGVLLSLKAVGLTPGSGEERHQWHRAEYLAWSFIAGLLSICFVAKGGTVNYIFVLGEPLLGMFAGAATVALIRWAIPAEAGAWRTLSLFNTMMFLRPAGVVGILFIVWIPAVQNIRATLAELQAELPAAKVHDIRLLISMHADRGDVILAPPFYAFISGTNVAAELAENYIWQIKYLNETFDAQKYGKPTGEGVEKMRELAALLCTDEVKLILLDMGQTGTVPEIREAIERCGWVLQEDDSFRTRNTRIAVYTRARR